MDCTIPIPQSTMHSKILPLPADVESPARINWTPHFFGSGGIYAAYLVGVPLSTVMLLLNHSKVAVSHNYYIYAVVRQGVYCTSIFLKVELHEVLANSRENPYQSNHENPRCHF